MLSNLLFVHCMILAHILLIWPIFHCARIIDVEFLQSVFLVRFKSSCYNGKSKLSMLDDFLLTNSLGMVSISEIQAVPSYGHTLITSHPDNRDSIILYLLYFFYYVGLDHISVVIVH